MFERYTEAARRTIFFARHEAVIRRGRRIAPEHLLLGLLREAASGSTMTWPAQAGSIPDVRAALEGLLPLVDASLAKQDVESRWAQQILLSNESKRVLQEAHRSGASRGDPHIGVEHLLLALLSYSEALTRRLGVGVSAKRFLKGRGLVREQLELTARNEPQVDARSEDK